MTPELPSVAHTAMVCNHCERRPAQADGPYRHLGLCGVCAAVKGIRRLYKRRRNFDPERERRVMELRRRAMNHLPLFEDTPNESQRHPEE